MVRRPPVPVGDVPTIQPVEPPPATPPLLVRASIRFHTNDDDKNDNTRLDVIVLTDEGRTIVATLSGYFGCFGDHTDMGPFDMVVVTPVVPERLRPGRVEIRIEYPSEPSHIIPSDTWRFNFFLDFLFADGAHLLARANGVELELGGVQMRAFAIE
jgi:hypothetical protein